MTPFWRGFLDWRYWFWGAVTGAELGGLGVLLTGCATVVPGRVIVLKNGTTYPCAYGVQLDSHYRCIGEDSAHWAPSYVSRVDP